MKQRLIVAAIGVPVTLLVILFLPARYFSPLVYVLCGFAIGELLDNVKRTRKFSLSIAAVIILFGFASLALYRDAFGAVLTLLPFACAYGGDAAAMHIGKLFGKRHPFPQISPNKTEWGAVGGVIGAVICAAPFYGLLGLNFIPVGAALGVAAEAGDLFFSLIKRKMEIKDYGSILPGHGGVLDRFDSMVFVAPVAFLLINLT
ncbi:MAG: phosphatidate cytidylyltransferase [Oscillospiraceae bacterium]|nr:phosphatidate cytidylyltransferase [Oscillospiraceae bacterium]